VIEDLEGATAEPSRRGHRVALSVASAAISLGLLAALVVPPPDVGTSESASPSASPSASAEIVMFARSDTRVTMTQVFSRDGTALLQCFVSSDGSASPLVLARPDVWGPSVVYVGPDRRTAHSVPVPVAAPRGWLSVNCATSNAFAPREMIAR